MPRNHAHHTAFTNGFYVDEGRDFAVRLLLGYCASGGADAGEVLATIANCPEEHDLDWSNAWLALGRRLVEAGDASAAAGHRVSAASAYLRASNYLAQAFDGLDGFADDEQRLPIFAEHRAAFEKFIDHGGLIGLQHDPLLYGAYLLNPFLVRVELVPMLIVNQGEVAVVKSFVGLPTIDTSGEEFKFGSIVAPGHRGIWREPLRTGKYPINPRCYAAEIVPTSIITLNWANANSQAHSLDAHLSPIDGKSREGFVFTIDLQVQIHVPDTRAPKVISMVGTMMNLVNEVLQSAVGNHFRNTLQQLEAIKFIETRHEVQAAAYQRVTEYLSQYQVETKGVYIQDVQFPADIVEVLTTREIANQEKATFEEQQRAQLARIELEKTKGTADQQANLAASQVGITIKQNEADARKAAPARGPLR